MVTILGIDTTWQIYEKKQKQRMTFIKNRLKNYESNEFMLAMQAV